jgi:hypothetical protein
MKQLTLKIPNNLYDTFIKFLQNNFSSIEITETNSDGTKVVSEQETTYETMLNSEKALAKDWLSKEEDEVWEDLP